MNDNEGAIVPFGKYRGKPIEAMLQDPSYCEWFMQQPEMRQKYSNVYQVVINNFGEPGETPESNEMQAAFLDRGFCIRFALAADPTFFDLAGEEGFAAVAMFAAEDVRRVKAALKIETAKAEWNDQQWVATGERVVSRKSDRRSGVLGRMLAENDHKEGWRFESAVLPLDADLTTPEFESEGTDVSFRVWGKGFGYKRAMGYGRSDGLESEVDWRMSTPDDRGWFEPADLQAGCRQIWQHHHAFRIEIKPEVGDDYPAILRQMRRAKANTLYTRDYCGVGVDENTFVEYFSTQGIRVIFERDVLAAAVPEAFVFDAAKLNEAIVSHLKSLDTTSKGGS